MNSNQLALVNFYRPESYRSCVISRRGPDLFRTDACNTLDTSFALNSCNTLDARYTLDTRSPLNTSLALSTGTKLNASYTLYTLVTS